MSSDIEVLEREAAEWAEALRKMHMAQDSRASMAQADLGPLRKHEYVLHEPKGLFESLFGFRL